MSDTVTQLLVVNWTLESTGTQYHQVLDFGIDFPWVSQYSSLFGIESNGINVYIFHVVDLCQ